MAPERAHFNYKDCSIAEGASNVGNSGPYKAHFTVSSENDLGRERIDQQRVLPESFDTQEEAFAAARLAGQAWVDEQAE